MAFYAVTLNNASNFQANGVLLDWTMILTDY